MNIFEKYSREEIFKMRQDIGMVNPHQYPTLDFMQVILLNQQIELLEKIYNKLENKNSDIKIELEELNKTQLLTHLQRAGFEISEFEKLSKEEILKKIGE